ncbi:hypothetical protein VTN31DRAFT_1216 [Thermomyces dupontii]|uniref:uncharacterized protein n=1 Tax=Talaromyces thermophilus TaxID=28565 RepID=UPI003743AB41
MALLSQHYAPPPNNHCPDRDALRSSSYHTSRGLIHPCHPIWIDGACPQDRDLTVATGFGTGSESPRGQRNPRPPPNQNSPISCASPVTARSFIPASVKVACIRSQALNRAVHATERGASPTGHSSIPLSAVFALQLRQLLHSGLSSPNARVESLPVGAQTRNNKDQVV